jgi:hypothetical protein
LISKNREIVNGVEDKLYSWNFHQADKGITTNISPKSHLIFFPTAIRHPISSTILQFLFQTLGGWAAKEIKALLRWDSFENPN